MESPSFKASIKIRVHISSIVALMLLISVRAYGGPWLSAGEPWSDAASFSTKSDVELLYSFGFIDAPVMVWPIAWDNIGPSLLDEDNAKRIKKMPSYVQVVYFRILKKYKKAISSKLKAASFVSGGGNINPFRTFDYQPRTNINAGLEAEKQGLHWAAEAAVSYGNYPDLTTNAHLDYSYLYGFIGNWGIGVDKMPRWWGPGYSDSLILSANAPALPTLTIQRMKAEAFQTKWLSWVGPWSFTTSLSVGGQDVPVPRPLIWLTNFAFHPIPSLQFNISRVAYFAGKTRPLNSEMLVNLLALKDNCYPPEHKDPNYCALYTPGTEHLEITASWSPIKTSSFYLQTIFNDGHPYLHVKQHPILHVKLPWRTSFLAGVSHTHPLFSGYLKPYVEYEYLVQHAYWFWDISDSHTRHKKFIIYDIYGYSQYPYTYYGKIIGSPLGGESQAINIGGTYTEPNGGNYVGQVRYLRLNPYGKKTPSYGYPFSRQNILWLSMNRTIRLPRALGQLSGQIGYLKAISQAKNGFKSSPSGFATWTKAF